MKLYPRFNKKAKPDDVSIAVYGLGKMGLPLAAVFADSGFTVIKFSNITIFLFSFKNKRK
jgi:UDP-N-acetyl-D-mannosaminuronate dehydrogenase